MIFVKNTWLNGCVTTLPIDTWRVSDLSTMCGSKMANVLGKKTEFVLTIVLYLQ